MKTMKTIYVIAIAILFTGAAYASGGGNLTVNMASTDDAMTSVEISTTKFSTFEIEVNGLNGESLYEMKTVSPTNTLKKRYDFSELQDGIYTYSVKIDKERTVQKFSVERGVAEVIESRKSIEPYFVLDKDMVKLTFLNPEGENVKLYVYDQRNTLLTEAELGDDLAIHKAVNFSDKEAGYYSMVLTNDLDVYEFDIAIE